MTAYEKVPQLWDPKLFPKRLKSEERNAYLQQIATEINQERNLELDTTLVGLISVRVRRHLRIILSRIKTAQDRKKAIADKMVPKWYFEALAFLEPSIKQTSMEHYDSRLKHLKKNQILQIIKIYKKFPNLWNSNLAENVCHNKRQEDREQMTEVIYHEMGLKINETSLKKYLENLNSNFTKEKGYALENKGRNLDKELFYYDHMQFLNDHVGPFICKFCGRKLQSPLYFKLHLHQSHHRGGPLKCQICDKEYEQVNPYVAHIRRHLNDLHDECKECGKRFIRHADLQMHMRTHTGAKPFVCEVCGASFSQRHSLTTHSRRHEQKFIHFCDICSKGFYEKFHLTRHMIKHSNVRNYPCKICGKAFKTKRHSETHETTHADNRLYPCPTCGKMFKNNIGVIQHLRTHRNQIEITSNPFES